MTTFIITVGLGVLISALGIINMTGNISSLHSYHRHRVTEENKKPFGRLVGAGTLTVGASMMVFGTLQFIFEKTQLLAFSIVGAAVLTVGVIVGLGLSFYAMIKYNKGIF